VWPFDGMQLLMHFTPLIYASIVLYRALVLGLATLLDQPVHGSWVLVFVNFFMFNFLSLGGDYYGTHKWHWYFTQGFTVMLFTFLHSPQPASSCPEIGGFLGLLPVF